MITDEAVPGVRPTIDVDAIAEITSYAEYVKFSERLRAIGFSEDISEGAPVCRWKHSKVTLDVMPLDEKILGFSNRWYPAALKTADWCALAPSLQIRLVVPPYFVATKLEAFKGRGGADYSIAVILKTLCRSLTVDRPWSMRCERQQAICGRI